MRRRFTTRTTNELWGIYKRTSGGVFGWSDEAADAARLLLSERGEDVPTSPADALLPPPEGWPPEDLPFSWGAAGATILWLFFHGKSWVALGLLVWFMLLRIASSVGPGVAGVAIMINLLITLGFGVMGNQIACQHRGYRNEEELKAGERGWTVFGAILLVLQGLLMIWAMLLLTTLRG